MRRLALEPWRFFRQVDGRQILKRLFAFYRLLVRSIESSHKVLKFTDGLVCTRFCHSSLIASRLADNFSASILSGFAGPEIRSLSAFFAHMFYPATMT